MNAEVEFLELRGLDTAETSLAVSKWNTSSGAMMMVEYGCRGALSIISVLIEKWRFEHA